jgi:hypothetical protein
MENTSVNGDSIREIRNNSCYLFQEIIQLPSLSLRRPPDLTSSFTRMKTGSLVLKSLHFFFRSDIYIMFDRFRSGHSFLQQAGDLYAPSFCFGFYLELIPDMNIPGSFRLGTRKFDLPAITGSSCQRPRFKETDRPQIFIQP